MIKSLMSRFNETEILFGGNAQQLEGLLSGLANHEHGRELMNARMDDDYWLPESDWRSYYQPYIVKDGILRIPVRGVLLHDFPWQLGDYATGYQYIWKAYERGLADGNVRAIALVEHSPGGEVAGCFDLVDKMFARRGEKPVRAFAHEYAYSAAYAVASVADSIIMSRTGGVGSIGVVMTHVDVSKMMDDIGWKVTFIYSGKHKVDGNPYEALPEDVRARMQARADDLRKIFAATVARNRDMDEKAVWDTEAQVYYAPDAVSEGLADSVGPLEDAIAAYAAEISTEEGDVQMSTNKDDAAANKAAIDQARAEGFEAGKKEGKAEGLTEGANAERERINGILACENGKTRPSAALAAALDTDMSVEQANGFLGKLSEENASTSTNRSEADTDPKSNSSNAFDQAMRQTGNPEVGSGDEEAAEGDEGNVVALAKSFGLSGIAS